jgi:hypothetical protein
MVIVKANKDSEQGVMPSRELFEAMGKFNEELVDAGIMLAGEGLHPSSKGKRILFTGNGQRVVDGPFAATNELVAGFWLWQCASMEEAMEWAMRCPQPHNGDCELEVRRVYEMEDFGDAFPPELREQEEKLIERLKQKNKG